MTSVTDQDSEIKSWLKTVFKDENIDNFSVNVVGGSEKGDGYLGDIVFLSLTPTGGQQHIGYDLVLKCSKRSKALRETLSVRSVFLNEMYIYDTVLPAFTQFQLNRGVTEYFNSVPKCYGTLETDEDMEIIVLENLKKLGYDLWDKKRPLTRKHVEMVIREYAKFHSVSIAMWDQNPEKFEELSRGLTNTFEELLRDVNMRSLFKDSIDDLCDVFEDELDESIILTWRNLRKKVDYVFGDMFKEMNGIKTIAHGDCWGNNFLFKHVEDNVDEPVNVAILDWQMSCSRSPILDLSYFLFATISKEDINNLDIILRYYHDSLRMFVKKLGSDLDSIYPLEEFFAEWNKYCIFGVTAGAGVFKVCATDKDEVLDIGDVADNGEHFTKSWDYKVKDKTCFKNRCRHVVEYVVANHLI